MKYYHLPIFSLLLISCSSDDESETPTHKDETVENKQVARPVEYVAPKVKHCEVISSEEIKDCTLYHLYCEDGSYDMVLLCRTRPIGFVLDPPRPVHGKNSRVYHH